MADSTIPGFTELSLPVVSTDELMIDRAGATRRVDAGEIVKLIVGTHTIYTPARAMIARASSGAAAGTTELATNDVMLASFDFDASADEFVQFEVWMPKSWNESTVTAKFRWTAASGSGNVIWAIQGLARSDDDALDTAFGTAVTVTDTLLTANDEHQTSATSAMTIGGTPAEGDVVIFQVYRDADAGGDTLAVDAKLLGVHIYITTNAVNDA